MLNWFQVVQITLAYVGERTSLQQCVSVNIFGPIFRVCLLTRVDLKIHPKIHILLCPRHDNGRGIKCYPCPSVCTYVHTYVRLSKRRPLSNSNTFDQNFFKLGHIVEYHDVFFKFNNDSYRTMFSVVMALCL